MRHGLYRRPGKARVLRDVHRYYLGVLRLRSNKSLGVGAMKEYDEYGQKLDGMTLRDYFAAKAMQGYITGDYKILYPHEVAQQAYAIADAMLEEQAK